MTPNIIVTCGTITSTWHDVSLTRDNFFNFKKKIIKKFKKNSKNPGIDT